eukprot:274433_1
MTAPKQYKMGELEKMSKNQMKKILKNTYGKSDAQVKLGHFNDPYRKLIIELQNEKYNHQNNNNNNNNNNSNNNSNHNNNSRNRKRKSNQIDGFNNPKLCLEYCDIIRMDKSRIEAKHKELVDFLNDNKHLGNSQISEQTMNAVGRFAYIVNRMDVLKQEFVLLWFSWLLNQFKRIDRAHQNIAQLPKPTFPY